MKGTRCPDRTPTPIGQLDPGAGRARERGRHIHDFVRTLAVTMEHPLEETIRLLDLTDDRLGVLVASNELEPSVKSALGELASRRQALGRQNAEVEKQKEQRRQLIEDEKRLRDNLAAVGRDTALYKQTLDKLGETEALITTLSTHIATAAAEIETAKEQLQRFVSALTL